MLPDDTEWGEGELTSLVILEGGQDVYVLLRNGGCVEISDRWRMLLRRKCRAQCCSKVDFSGQH
jgi:hypothetical protein